MKRPEKFVDALDEHGKIRPDPEDYEAVANHPDNPNASPTQNAADKYRLAQMVKLLRLYEAGLLPVEMMREFDRLLKGQA
jgi:hypothetical protein